ncbi:MAG TPA: hypothetical protein VFT98_18240 [Myxococcota bacterium]|nr:hypothetical protein [Myxococcota bacterium]
MICRPLRALLLGFVVLLAGAPALAQNARVAVLPVVIHSIEESGYLRAGISEMLTSRLSQQAGITTIRVDDASAASADLAAARAAARNVGADWVLFGSFTRFGEGASLDLRCVPVNSEAPASARSVFVHAGALAELIPRLDSVVARVGTHVRGGVANAEAPVAAAPAGPDLAAEVAALKARIEALEAKGAAQPSAGNASN